MSHGGRRPGAGRKPGSTNKPDSLTSRFAAAQARIVELEEERDAAQAELAGAQTATAAAEDRARKLQEFINALPMTPLDVMHRAMIQALTDGNYVEAGRIAAREAPYIHPRFKLEDERLKRHAMQQADMFESAPAPSANPATNGADAKPADPWDELVPVKH